MMMSPSKVDEVSLKELGLKVEWEKLFLQVDVFGVLKLILSNLKEL
jgi:hypothetical protein